jgi:transcriptional regulator GlxA family with amidase domain
MPWLGSVCECIEGNLHLSLTVTELAMVAGVSPSHFSRVFRQAMGESPYHYVRRKRLDRAESLIVETQLPFREIAGRAGVQRSKPPQPDAARRTWDNTGATAPGREASGINDGQVLRCAVRLSHVCGPMVRDRVLRRRWDATAERSHERQADST